MRKSPSPVAELTPAEQEAKTREWKQHGLLRTVNQIREAYEHQRDKLVEDLQKDQGLYWSSVARFEVLTHKYRAIAGLARVEDADERNREAQALVVRLTELVLRNARGAHDCGDLNSTSAFSRFAAAAQMSAMAELVEDLPRLTY